MEHVDETIVENRDDLAKLVDRLLALEGSANELLVNLNAVVEENRPPLNATLIHLEELTRTTSDQIEELAASLQLTLRYLQQLSGDASDLVDKQRPTLEQILVNLEATSRNLKQLSQTLAEQPNALVRGAKPQGRADGGQR
jgi:ABC-type transporter Mla subunit MlaD